MDRKLIRFIIGLAFAALAFAFLGRSRPSESDYDKSACAGPPLRTVEARNAAMEAGYTINRQYDCIDQASFASINREKAAWQSGHRAAQLEPPRGHYTDAQLHRAATEAKLEEGMNAYKTGDYAKALAVFQSLADEGDTTGQFMLGSLYHDGLGVEKDDARAFTWTRKAAERANPKAQALLAVMYQEGWGTAKDEARAVEWFRMSAEQGYATAQLTLGLLYMKGRGVAINERVGMLWIERAAWSGSDEAQLLLGMAYHEGRADKPKDDKKARFWLEHAAQQGNADAKRALQEIHQSAPLIP